MNQEDILKLNSGGLLAEVVGYETTEVVKFASGSKISTLSGRNFLDFTGGIAVHACGHNHPAVVQAIIDQTESVLHTSDILRRPRHLQVGA